MSAGPDTRLCVQRIRKTTTDVRFRVGFDPMGGKKNKKTRAKRPQRGSHALKTRKNKLKISNSQMFGNFYPTGKWK